ncbi:MULTISPECIES: PadR family transcriptional regulator [Gemella]|uniref:PadR family transcriptional regulator n=1 Tax=Gemella TaxID=1378 RepID=UPI000767EDF3|nr:MULTISPECIES: helix-turn-helix transcriptional regulator [Gemella]AME09421.1 PadR family transcriptional regulator [Gemella sp. oral taxon 928]AXI27057.1 PadR family transcriptional regulator [Gemella sp. ND 6198]
MKISLTEQIILGLLAEQPQHGYHIENLITERGMRKSAEIGFSSIYYVLERLEKKQLATSLSTKGKEKKQYKITDLGMEVLKEKTKNQISERKPANTHLMTGLATSHLINTLELITALEDRQAVLLTDLKILQEKMKKGSNVQAARQLFSLSEVLLKAELSWIKNELERLRK